MSLLNEIFDTDRIRIMEVNRKYMFILGIIAFFIVISLLFIEKKHYYVNTITSVGESVVLVSEKEMINIIKNNKKIIIGDIEFDYSINRIEVLEDVSFIYLNVDKENIHSNTYKIYLGKENVLEYIIRTLKK